MGDFSPGESLNEKELMKHYRIGRTPLREILLDFQREGFIKLVPNRGTFVSPMDINDFKYLSEMRLPLERLAVDLAIDRITDPQLEKLRQILLKVKELGANEKENYEELIKYESKFHNIIYEATQNPLLMDTLHRLQAISIRFWTYITFGKKELSDQFFDHNELLESIINKDKDRATKITERHMNYFKNIII